MHCSQARLWKCIYLCTPEEAPACLSALLTGGKRLQCMPALQRQVQLCSTSPCQEAPISFAQLPQDTCRSSRCAARALPCATPSERRVLPRLSAWIKFDQIVTRCASFAPVTCLSTYTAIQPPVDIHSLLQTLSMRTTTSCWAEQHAHLPKDIPAS